MLSIFLFKLIFPQTWFYILKWFLKNVLKVSPIKACDNTRENYRKFIWTWIFPSVLLPLTKVEFQYLWRIYTLKYTCPRTTLKKCMFYKRSGIDNIVNRSNLNRVSSLCTTIHVLPSLQSIFRGSNSSMQFHTTYLDTKPTFGICAARIPQISSKSLHLIWP